MADPDVKRRIRIETSDITLLRVDAIVNAAYTSLLGGGGVDGAIYRAAGPELLAECRRLGGCAPGEARLIRGYQLPAGHLIHTVGPIWQGGTAGEDRILEACYRSSLAIARVQRCRDIAFPATATGIYGNPRYAAARVAVAAACSDLAEQPSPELVASVCFDETTRNAYREALGRQPKCANRSACRLVPS